MRRGFCLFVLLAAGANVPSAWSLDSVQTGTGQRLAMPYSCSVENGAIGIRPGPELTFDVAGGVERRLVTKCDPPFSNNCTSITVHRFDMMCGSQRVPWMQVVAAIGRTTAGAASIAKGHLVLEREPESSSGNAPSCSDLKPAMGVGMPGECLPWRVTRPMDQMVLPQGFAPVREAGARIIGDKAASEWAAADLMAQRPDAMRMLPEADEPDEPILGIAREENSEMPVAGLTNPGQGLNGGWSTSLTVYTGEPQAPEYISIGSLGATSDKSAASSAAWSISFNPWFAVLGCFALAGFYLTRTGHMRLAEPYVSGMLSGASRHARKIQDLSFGAVAELRSRLEPPPPPASDPQDPALDSALLQLKAMLARTEAAVSMHSSTAVLREVMQSELAVIRRRLEETETAVQAGHLPVMKVAGQLRQIGREIERVQRISESAAQSFQSRR